MASGKAKVCHRTGKKIYPADKSYEVKNLKETWYFSSAGFSCKSTGARLTMKSYVVFEDEVYLRGKEPIAKPTQVPDVIDSRVAVVPDANFRTDDRMFNVAGKQAARGTKGEDLGSAYGTDAVSIKTQTSVPDHIHRDSDQKFVIAGNAGLKASTQVMPGSNYGLDGQVMDTQVNVVKPAAVGIDNVDMKQIRHNGLGEGNLYTGVKGDEGAAE